MSGASRASVSENRIPCLDLTRRDGVNPDAMGCEVVRHLARQTAERRFGRCIGRAGKRVDTRADDRRHIDDRTRAGFERRRTVRGPAIPVRGSSRGTRSSRYRIGVFSELSRAPIVAFRRQAGIVDKRMQWLPREPRFDFVDRPRHGAVIAEIDLHVILQACFRGTPVAGEGKARAGNYSCRLRPKTISRSHGRCRGNAPVNTIVLHGTGGDGNVRPLSALTRA